MRIQILILRFKGLTYAYDLPNEGMLDMRIGTMASNQFPYWKKDHQFYFLYYNFKSFKSSLLCKRFYIGA